MKPLFLAALLLATTPALAWRNYHRDPEVPRTFQRTHPCPSTGRTSGRCPGYVRDHVVPLCAGGADSPSNIQWQTREAGARKDRDEWALCRSLHRRR